MKYIYNKTKEDLFRKVNMLQCPSSFQNGMFLNPSWVTVNTEVIIFNIRLSTITKFNHEIQEQCHFAPMLVYDSIHPWARSYNLGQNKMEQQSPISPKSRMKAREGQKRAIFPSLIWGEGGSRFYIYFVQDCRSLWLFLPSHVSENREESRVFFYQFQMQLYAVCSHEGALSSGYIL